MYSADSGKPKARYLDRQKIWLVGRKAITPWEAGSLPVDAV
ncbi:hypothetical protein VB715_09980 [Crocosphaera sp. UHCC 0190]|nr:hypothetical protein [Crocosphaera sp. UHCC 0190]MEA5510091.1 hypothetical protein [Crocosphaera sp. UHCC 0190]